jgi:hypothetical protein
VSVTVEFECDFQGCNEGAGINRMYDPNRMYCEVDMPDWQDGRRIATYLPEGWTVFGSKTLFTYCPKHS